MGGRGGGSLFSPRTSVGLESLFRKRKKGKEGRSVFCRNEQKQFIESGVTTAKEEWGKKRREISFRIPRLLLFRVRQKIKLDDGERREKRADEQTIRNGSEENGHCFALRCCPACYGTWSATTSGEQGKCFPQRGTQISIPFGE